jgi:uncharacterized protein (DUF983 family)
MKTWSLSSLLRLRCPVCGGDTFKAGLFRTAKACSVCGQVFERESGFFAGAIYPFYGLAVGLGAVVFAFCLLLLDLSFGVGLGAAGVIVALASPRLFWLSRLAFLHTDHRFFGEED